MFIYDLNYKSYQNVAILLIFYATDRSSKNIWGLNLSRSFKRHGNSKIWKFTIFLNQNLGITKFFNVCYLLILFNTLSKMLSSIIKHYFPSCSSTFPTNSWSYRLNPAGTERPEDVPLWSFFGWDIPDHNWTKIGCIRVLTYFGSAMPDIHLTSENIEKLP